jgi:hypothetical protein
MVCGLFCFVTISKTIKKGQVMETDTTHLSGSLCALAELARLPAEATPYPELTSNIIKQ